IRAQAAEDGVRQPALLAHVLKQTRAHRAAEQRVEHVARVPVVVVLRIAADAEAHVALLELLVAHENLGDHARRLIAGRIARFGQRSELLADELAHPVVLEVADRRDDQVPGRIDAPEVITQQLRVERLDRLLRAEDRTAERMILPEALREELVDEVVERVLDHLDLFDDDFLLALDVLGAERRVADDIGEDVDRERQMLVEDLDVVARVLLGGEGVELPADGVDRLCNILGRAARGALEQHVLDEMRDAPALGRFVAGAPGEPYADADRSDLRHLLGEKAKSVIENVSNDRYIQGEARSGARVTGPAT